MLTLSYIFPIPVPYAYKASKIDVEIWFVETINKGNVLAKMSMNKISSGKHGIGPEASRLQATYANCGKALAKYLNKNKVFKP